MPKFTMKEAAEEAEKELSGLHGDIKKLTGVVNKDMTQFEQKHGATSQAVDIYEEAKLGKSKYSVADAKDMFEKHEKNLSVLRTKLAAHAKLAGNYKKTVNGIAVQIKNVVQSAADKSEAEAAFKDVQKSVKKLLEGIQSIIELTTGLPSEPSID